MGGPFVPKLSKPAFRERRRWRPGPRLRALMTLAAFAVAIGVALWADYEPPPAPKPPRLWQLTVFQDSTGASLSGEPKRVVVRAISEAMARESAAEHLRRAIFRSKDVHCKLLTDEGDPGVLVTAYHP